MRSGGWRVPVFLAFAFGSAAPVLPETLLSSTTHQSITLIDPELVHSVAPPPVLSPEAPPSFRLPEVIADSRQWRGLRCGVTLPRYALFRHDDKWKSFWEKGIAPYASGRWIRAPEIDFSKDMVVGVFLGERPDPHYGVEIRSVKPLPDSDPPVKVVRYREIRHMIGVFTPSLPVQPFHLRKIPRFDGDVVFEPVKR